ncbi:MAG TPA: response regulator [Vicinamibacterales bacterium]|nr:response regulator [Vicinamibacterales bacterium]
MGKRVLIIEDNEILAHAYAASLRTAGFQVAVARDGQAGLDAVGRFTPDIVVLDLMLPRVPGIDVLRRIRSDEAHAAIPVIVFSNRSDRTAEVWDAGATQVVMKADCPPKHLVEIVSSIA